MIHYVLRAAGLGLAASLAACATVPSAPPQPAAAPPGVTLVDRAHRFDAVWQSARTASADAQWAAIRAAFAGDMPGFYEDERFGDMADFVRGVRGDNLAAYPRTRAAALAAADDFVAGFPAAVTRFEREIGPLPAQQPVALVMSLGEFDGAVRDFGQGPTLFFGADEIARIYPGASTAPFLQHELFHTYHGPKLGECQPLWCALWNEGLAVYAAKRLNPGASDVELGLAMPAPIRPVLEARRRDAVCAVRARLDGGDGYMPIFTGMGDPLDGLPHRFGYLVGLWVAEDLGRGHSLAEMAEWTGPDLRAKIGSSLAAMATCP